MRPTGNIHPTRCVKAHPHTTVEWPAQGGLLYTLCSAVAGSGRGGWLVAHLGPSRQHVNMLAVPHQLWTYVTHRAPPAWTNQAGPSHSPGALQKLTKTGLHLFGRSVMAAAPQEPVTHAAWLAWWDNHHIPNLGLNTRTVSRVVKPPNPVACRCQYTAIGLHGVEAHRGTQARPCALIFGTEYRGGGG